MVEFWLSDGSTAFRFPVNPPSLQITRGFTHKEIAVMGLGEITFPQSPELTRYSFSSFFPVKYNPTYCEYVGFPAPIDCVERIAAMMVKGKPLRLTVTGSPINTLVTIRNFDYNPWEHGDNDVPFSLELTEYRTPTVARVVVESAPATVSADPPKATTGTVNVGRGKTLTVRKTASSRAKSAGKLSNGAAVTIMATVSGWYQIKTAKLTGYVPTKYVTVSTSETAIKSTATVETTRPVEIRDKGVATDD